MTILLSWLCWGASQEEVCLDPCFLCNLTPPRFSVELPLTSGTTIRVTGTAPMAMRTGNSMMMGSWQHGLLRSTTFLFRNPIESISGRSGGVLMTIPD